MPVQIRPNRIDVTDRYPMLAFVLQSSEGLRQAEVVLVSQLALLTEPGRRTSGNFYSSREHGMLSIPASGSVYTVPPQVLARFIGAERLYFALATAEAPGGQVWRVDMLPTQASPYISLRSLTDRALRRVRMYPAQTRTRSGPSAAVLSWTGDAAISAGPGSSPATGPASAPAPTGGLPSPAVPYNDGFGPLPPLRPAEPIETAPQPDSGTPAVAAQGLEAEVDPDTREIGEPVLETGPGELATAMQARSPLTVADYPGARLMPSPAFTSGRGRSTINRIVIHITGAPQGRWIGSNFTRAGADSSAHYMVDQNGAIMQFVREQDRAWHAIGGNSDSIGIEHVAIQRGGARYERPGGGFQTFPHTPPSQIELETSAQLVAHLCRKYGLTPDRNSIVGHNEIDTRPRRAACPTGAWDWDAYIPLVRSAYDAMAPGGVSGATPPAAGTVRGTPAAAHGLAGNQEVDPETRGIEGCACSEHAAPAVAAGMALGAAEYDGARVASSPAFTAGRSGQRVGRIVIHITDAPTTQSTVNAFTNAGAQASAHYLVGQDGEIVQFVSEDDTAWHARGANRTSIGIEHVAVKAGGADYPRPGGGMQHFDALPPSDIQYSHSAALVAHLCDKYGITPSRQTIIGHNEADPRTNHSACPTGNWNWDHYMRLVTERVCAPQPAAQGLASAMTAGSDTVEIKYRAFIPSPALKGPFIDNYHGDGRGFSYSSGTSRGEITFTVDLSSGGGLSGLRYVDRHWSPSHSYSAADTSAVAGKPSWWLDLRSGAVPTDTGTCAASDDTLKAYIGGSGTTANVLAVAENASLVTLEMAGNNPLIPGSPAIDATISILLRRAAGGGIEAKAFGSHDGFPAHELYVNRTAVHQYDPASSGNGPDSLLPPEDISVSTGWTTIGSAGGPASGQSLARSLDVADAATAPTGTRLVFSDVAGNWSTNDFDDVSLTRIAWDNAPDKAVAFVFFGHPGLDDDGSPTAYHPDDTGDDALANAYRHKSGDRWYGVKAYTPAQANAIGSAVLLDQRPERLLQGKYPVIQQAANGDPNPGYYVSTTSAGIAAVPQEYKQGHYFNAKEVPFGALGGGLRRQGMKLGNLGLAVRHDSVVCSPFRYLDSGPGGHSLGEVSRKVITNLGGQPSRNGRRRNYGNNYPTSFIVFPGEDQKPNAPFSGTDLAPAIAAKLGGLATASNARDLALLMALAEVRAGRAVPGVTALDRFHANPGASLPSNYANVVASLAANGFAFSEPAATAQALQLAQGMGTDDWTINWDEVEQIPQPTDMGCWATSAAMVVGWRDQVCIDPNEIARFTRLQPEMISGLGSDQVKRFFAAVGLRPGPAACFTAEGFRQLLEADGPAFVIARVPGLHAIVVTGMYRKDGRDYVRVTDPWDRVVGSPGAPGSYATTHTVGSRYILTYEAFAAEYEATAGWGDHQLAFGGMKVPRQPNRGPAIPAGYAQGLSAQDRVISAESAPEAAPAVVPQSSPAPAAPAAPVEPVITRTSFQEDGRSYDLAQLSGMVRPGNALAGGAGMPPIPGERVRLNDWPFITDGDQSVQANLAIDWKFDGAAIGEISIVPDGGTVANGRTIAVKADILPGASTENRAAMLVRVTTTFSKPGEADQSAVNEVTLSGDGRSSRNHLSAEQPPAQAEPAPPPSAPETAAQPQPAMA